MADISFGGLTFSGSFTAPASAGLYTLMWLGCPAGATKRAMADYEFMGLDGIQSIDGGARPRLFTMDAMIIGFDAAGVADAEEDILAEQDGTSKTFTRWGTTLTGVELLEIKPGRFKTGQFCYENIQLTFRQL
jgi:hypothetical protein